MDLKVISELVKMMSDSKLSTLEVESKELRIRLEKNTAFHAEKGNYNGSGAENSSIFKREEVKSEAAVEKIAVETMEDRAEFHSLNKNTKLIKSPIVGTFYASASPDSESFAAVGKKVKKGDTLCIIEAMKLMNEIESEYDGEIVEILVQNGSMVEYGQPMFRLR
jgi:acetyl-CoA carboxylase biotin carboxyl carrier protein